MNRVCARAGLAAACLAATAGCDVILGLKDATLYAPDAGTGGTGGSSSTASGSSSGSGGGGTHAGGSGGTAPCANSTQDGNESDVDCGGSCPPCPDGKHCNAGSDCQSMVCTQGVCVPVCTIPPCPGDTLWAKRFGDSADQRIQSIAAAGNRVLLTGWFSGNIDFGGGNLTSTGQSDMFVANLMASNGDYFFSKRFGGDASSYQYGEAVVTNVVGDVYVFGDLGGNANVGGNQLVSAGKGDVFGARLSDSGGVQWANRFGDGDYQFASSIALDSTNHVLVTGRNEGTIDFGNGPITNPTAGFLGGGAVYLAKFDADGSAIWSKGFGDGVDQYGVAVTTDPQDNVLLLASGGGTFDFGGGVLPGAFGDVNVFVAKLAPDGSHIWSKAFGDSASQDANCITTDMLGNVYILASGAGAIDFGGGPLAGVGDRDIFLAKLTPSGNHIWSRRYGHSGSYAIGAGLVVDTAENVFVAGRFKGQIDLGGGLFPMAQGVDTFVARLASNGAHVWSRAFGGANDQQVRALTLAGSLFLVGDFTGQIDFGTGTLTSAGKSDAFVAKIYP